MPGSNYIQDCRIARDFADLVEATLTVSEFSDVQFGGFLMRGKRTCRLKIGQPAHANLTGPTAHHGACKKSASSNDYSLPVYRYNEKSCRSPEPTSTKFQPASSSRSGRSSKIASAREIREVFYERLPSVIRMNCRQMELTV